MSRIEWEREHLGRLLISRRDSRRGVSRREGDTPQSDGATIDAPLREVVMSREIDRGRVRRREVVVHIGRRKSQRSIDGWGVVRFRQRDRERVGRGSIRAWQLLWLTLW
jgi:hypothetical protein